MVLFDLIAIIIYIIYILGVLVVWIMLFFGRLNVLSVVGCDSVSYYGLNGFVKRFLDDY